MCNPTPPSTPERKPSATGSSSNRRSSRLSSRRVHFRTPSAGSLEQTCAPSRPAHARSPSADDVLLTPVKPRAPRKAISPGLAERKKKKAFIANLEADYGRGGSKQLHFRDFTHYCMPRLLANVLAGSRDTRRIDGWSHPIQTDDRTPLFESDPKAKYGVVSGESFVFDYLFLSDFLLFLMQTPCFVHFAQSSDTLRFAHLRK